MRQPLTLFFMFAAFVLLFVGGVLIQQLVGESGERLWHDGGGESKRLRHPREPKLKPT
jgi:hypothetical protein